MILRKKVAINGLILVLFIVIFSIFSLAIDTPSFNNESTKILLKYKQFIPEKGISIDAQQLINSREAEARTHLLVQFNSDLNEDNKKELENLGIKLVAYIPNNAWYVSVPNNRVNELLTKNYVRAIDVIQPEYKKSELVRTKNFEQWTLTEDNGVYLFVKFHRDISLDIAENLITSFEGIVINRIEFINALTVLLNQNKIDSISELDEVQWIEEIPPLVEDKLDKSKSAISVNTL